MRSDEYDVCIIGAGATGAATAYALRGKKIRTVVVDREADAAFGVSKANSGIVHAGFHYPAESTLKGKLELAGNRLFPELHEKLGFPFRKCGILVAAFSEEEMKTAAMLFERGKSNGVPGIELCGAERMYGLEPKLAEGVRGGVFAPEGGVVEPYGYVYALMEAAENEGVVFERNFNVARAVRTGDFWNVTAEDGREIRAKRVVNAAGLGADRISARFGAEKFTILARKGEEYLLDRLSPAYPEHVIFPVPAANSKGVLVIPTVEGTTMIGPTARITEDREDRSTTEADRENIFRLAGKMVKGVSKRDLITAFSGSRPALEGGDFYLAESKLAPGLIQAAGIQSPGLTASPAVGRFLVELLGKSGLLMPEKTGTEEAGYEKPLRFRDLSPEEADGLWKKDPAWTNLVCRCEKISEAEIVRAVRHGHTTLDAIKLYTRAGMGRCQGGFCSAKIYAIVSRETGIPVEELTKRGEKSEFFAGSLADVAFKGETYEKI